MVEARAEALREISDTLGVRVHSTGEMASTMRGGHVNRDSRFSLTLVSGALLDDLTTMRSARVWGRYYLALGYDNRTLFQKLSGVLRRHGGAVPRLSSGFKATLPLSHDLSRLGILPSDFKVVRRHGRWCLATGQALYPLSGESLFVEKRQNRGMRMAVSPSGPLKTGSRYVVHVTPPRAMGYLSLYHVSSSGQTIRLMINHPVDALAPVQFPDATRYAGLEAMATDGKGGRDMLLAIWTPERVPPVASSIPVSTTPLAPDDERFFGYGALLESLGEALWVSHFVWIQGDF